MIHHVAHSVYGTLLVRDHLDCAALWKRLAGLPGLVALAIMPTHIHVQTTGNVSEHVARVMRSYARWRNARRGVRGQVWAAAPPAEGLLGADKQRRQRRYIHLNPCRARMNRDPAEWPWTTHRDSIGLAATPIVRAERNPHGWHRYVSGDPSCSVQGTELPLVGSLELREANGLELVWEAASAATRTPLSRMRRRGPARSLFVRAARVLTEASTSEIGARAGMSLRAVQRTEPVYDAQVQIVERIAGDPRFPALEDGALHEAFGKYRHLR